MKAVNRNLGIQYIKGERAGREYSQKKNFRGLTNV